MECGWPENRRCNPTGLSADLSLTPFELIDRIVALVPPRRKHKLRYFGALAPNSPLREAVIAMAFMYSGATSKVPAAGAVRGDRVIRARKHQTGTTAEDVYSLTDGTDSEVSDGQQR